MSFFRRFLPVASEAHFAAPDAQRRIPLYDPTGASGRPPRTFRRRLRDRVEDLFQDACVAGDLETAEELLTIVENMQKRREYSGQDRRVEDEFFATAREELARRRRPAR
jgi:hypothetical protein